MFNVTVYRTGMYKVRILGGYDYSKTLLGPKKTELVGYRKSTHSTVYCTVQIQTRLQVLYENDYLSKIYYSVSAFLLLGKFYTYMFSK